MNDVVEETEEQAAARILAWRTEKALSGAAATVAHIRTLVGNSSGHTEAGVDVPEESTPLITGWVDDADSLYVQLLNWVGFWSETLEVNPPSTAVVAWSNFKELQGFKAGTTPEGARFLVQLQTMWLNGKAELIDGHQSAGVYRDDVTGMLGSMRAKYKLFPERSRPITLRPCPLCGVDAVGASWLPEDPANEDLTPKQRELVQLVNVDVRCEHCGLFVPVLSPSQVLRWLR